MPLYQKQTSEAQVIFSILLNSCAAQSRLVILALTSGKLQLFLCQELCNSENLAATAYSTGNCWDWKLAPKSIIIKLFTSKLLTLSLHCFLKTCHRKVQDTYFLRCSCSLRNNSVRLLLTPEPLLYVLEDTHRYTIKNVTKGHVHLSCSCWKLLR